MSGCSSAAAVNEIYAYFAELGETSGLCCFGSVMDNDLMLMKKIHLAWAALALLIHYGCAPQQEEVILGSWKVDSVYYFHNGFDFWEREEGADWATYEYTPDERMKEIKFGTFRPYRYRLSGDTLRWIAEREAESGWFEILALQPSYMVLKKYKAPIFGGEGQERYEIRFFSRTKDVGKADAYLEEQ
jgi:hypothetical protein